MPESPTACLGQHRHHAAVRPDGHADAVDIDYPEDFGCETALTCRLRKSMLPTGESPFISASLPQAVQAVRFEKRRQTE